ncbi:hypothetical protein ACFQZT_29045 [Paenibacillus sp. GCM10027628]|uniref:hypothetical protein n=1 Tax=Paenibacillus sp. GCM10027628 TaxID=3273413 RepID=UPI003629BA21
MLANDWRQPVAVGNVGNVGNVGTVWPPGITGVKIYGSLPSGVHFIGPIHGYHHVPYYMSAPVYLGFPNAGTYIFF